MINNVPSRMISALAVGIIATSTLSACGHSDNTRAGTDEQNATPPEHLAVTTVKTTNDNNYYQQDLDIACVEGYAFLHTWSAASSIGGGGITRFTEMDHLCSAD